MLNLKESPEKAAADSAQQIAVANRADLIFIVRVISILFCCVGGLVATYIAYKAKQDAAAGDIASAKRRIRFATGSMIISFVIGILGLIGKLSEGR